MPHPDSTASAIRASVDPECRSHRSALSNIAPSALKSSMQVTLFLMISCIIPQHHMNLRAMIISLAAILD
jgi:hypothetical protein